LHRVTVQIPSLVCVSISREPELGLSDLSGQSESDSLIKVKYTHIQSELIPTPLASAFVLHVVRKNKQFHRVFHAVTILFCNW